ncbi:MAG: SMP-30/gluconolactonase/LRE family protein [Rhodopseudomonas palustris]|nr:SMP-30/gluconolactonase/LRE family protein [Rhodopseudomonas palustris]
MLDDMMISNGLAWSPDGRTMYHADTPTQTRPRLRLRRRCRNAVERRACSRSWSATSDRPDGATVDADGCYWIGVLPRRQGGARVAARARRSPSIPCRRVCPTMCALGGPRPEHAVRDERAASSATAEELARLPQSGGIFAMRVDVPGPA